MSYFSFLSLSSNIYKIAKVWQFEEGKICFFGSQNASGKLRFTNNHHINDTVNFNAGYETDLLEIFSKYLNLELEYVKNDELIRDGKTEVINMLTKNVCISKCLTCILLN